MTKTFAHIYVEEKPKPQRLLLSAHKREHPLRMRMCNTWVCAEQVTRGLITVFQDSVYKRCWMATC